MWAESSFERVYPNLFLLFVAPPGVGKTQAIKRGEILARRTKKLKIAPDDLTKAALLDELKAAMQTKVYGPTEMFQYHALCIFADELGVFLPSHDLSFLSVMNKLFDVKDSYVESRRSREENLVIVNPVANFIAGTQPDFLSNLLPPEAWGMGFMSRMLMIYQGKPVKQALFGKKYKFETKDLVEDLSSVCELHGEYGWSDEATTELVLWYDADLEPVPQHSKLKHYNTRRILNVMKLAIISAAAKSNELIITLSDVVRAREWLLEIEALMPDIFKDMSGQSDILLIQDLHFALQTTYDETKEDIHESKIYAFLSARTPPYNVENIIKLMVGSKVLIPGLPGYYRPGAKNNLTYE